MGNLCKIALMAILVGGFGLVPRIGHAADACASLMASADPVADALALEQQQMANPGDLRPLWQSATTLRCTIPAMAGPADRCLRAGSAKALYDKFVNAATGTAARAVKKELADARKSADGLRAVLAEPCAALALQTAKDGKHGAAAELYESVYVLTYRPLLLFNAARACELGSLWNQAAVYYTAYLALPIPWRDRRDAVGKLVEIQRRLASDTGDLVHKAEQLALAAQQGAVHASAKAQDALQQAKSADQRAQSADQRAQSADQRAVGAAQQAQTASQQAQAAAQQAQNADQRAQVAESRAVGGEQRVARAETRAYNAERRASQAEERAAAAEKAAQDLAARLAELELTVRRLQKAGGQPRR